MVYQHGVPSLHSRPLHCDQGLRQFPAKPGHQCGQHLIPGTSVTTRHIRTLLLHKITYSAIKHHRGISPVAAK
jgi:hypothetical protein